MKIIFAVDIILTVAIVEYQCRLLTKKMAQDFFERLVFFFFHITLSHLCEFVHARNSTFTLWKWRSVEIWNNEERVGNLGYKNKKDLEIW